MLVLGVCSVNKGSLSVSNKFDYAVDTDIFPKYLMLPTSHTVHPIMCQTTTNKD